jgi:hypothetical protein
MEYVEGGTGWHHMISPDDPQEVTQKLTEIISETMPQILPGSLPASIGCEEGKRRDSNPRPLGHDPFGIAIPLGKPMIYRGVFLALVGRRGVVWGQLRPLAGTVIGTVGHNLQARQ